MDSTVTKLQSRTTPGIKTRRALKASMVGDAAPPPRATLPRPSPPSVGAISSSGGTRGAHGSDQNLPLDPFLVRAWLWWTMQTAPTRIAIELVAFWVMLGVVAALRMLFA